MARKRVLYEIDNMSLFKPWVSSDLCDGRRNKLPLFFGGVWRLFDWFKTNAIFFCMKKGWMHFSAFICTHDFYTCHEHSMWWFSFSNMGMCSIRRNLTGVSTKNVRINRLINSNSFQCKLRTYLESQVTHTRPRQLTGNSAPRFVDVSCYHERHVSKGQRESYLI